MRTGMLFVLLCIAAGPAISKGTALQSDSEVRKAIIEESIAAYSGRCPCPYNTMKNGRACGGRSAYSRPGGRSPLCYPKDISDEMVRQYRRTHP